jgi:hypothetical protein
MCMRRHIKFHVFLNPTEEICRFKTLPDHSRTAHYFVVKKALTNEFVYNGTDTKAGLTDRTN